MAGTAGDSAEAGEAHEHEDKNRDDRKVLLQPGFLRRWRIGLEMVKRGRHVRRKAKTGLTCKSGDNKKKTTHDSVFWRKSGRGGVNSGGGAVILKLEGWVSKRGEIFQGGFITRQNV